jgi:hypothetical protein
LGRGQTAFSRHEFDSLKVNKPRNVAGEQFSTVKVSTNDRLLPVATVRISWLEITPFSMTPKSVDLGWIAPGQAAQADLHVLVASNIEPDGS